jgi:outer membrane protein OmpA-like peptidoglycan-associated protein
VRGCVAALAVAAAVFLAGCASTTRVTLLPQPDGRPSAVEVTPEREGEAIGGMTKLSHPYESAEVGSAQVQVEQLDAQEVQKRHARLMAVQPAPSDRFMLYFETGSSDLTTESQAALDRVLSEAIARPGGEIVVTGHTDSVGAPEYNDALSLERAQFVREMIIKRGFNPNRVYACGRGKRDLLVPTADQVDEPKNRRVEILVR